MFTAEQRERVRQRLLGLAEADDAICGAAVTGSHAGGGGDEWSDIDVAFAVDGSLGPAMERWTGRLYRDFGTAVTLGVPASPEVRTLAGRAWHHALHARASIARGSRWQAEYWISAVRDLVVALACLRLGYPASYAKGAHLLPAEVTAPLERALVGSLDPAELRRALTAAIWSLAAELERTDQALAAGLNPMLAELGRPP